MKTTPALRSFHLGTSLLAHTITATIGLSIGAAQAATYTWDGGSAVGNNFSDENWTGGTPTDLTNHIIAFGPLISPFQATANNNLTSGNPNQFIFNSGAAAMTVTGNALQFAQTQVNPIVNNSANLQTFTAEVRQFWSATGNKTWSAAAGNLSFANVVMRGDLKKDANPTLTVDGAFDTAISGTITQLGWTTGGASLIKAGAGKLTLGNNSSLDTVTIEGGTLRLTGGTLTTTKEGITNLGIRLTGGTLEVAGGNISVGTYGLGSYSADTGALNVTAGNVEVAGALIVGWNSSPTFTVSGGTLTSGSIRHQDGGSGILTIGGTGVVTAGDVYHNANGTGTDSLTLNLNGGGELEANRLYMSLGTNAQSTGNHSLNVNFDGGKLTAGASAASNLIDATPTGTSTRAINLTVKAGGAVIDTNGKTVSIVQSFLHDAALGVDPDGGLRKTGVGTLTLTETNTYTGATNVNGGTLVVNGSIANSATTVETTGVLTGTGNLGSSLTVKSTGVVNAGTVGTINTTATVTGATSFESGSIFSWDLSANGGTGDKLTSGSVSGSGAIFRILLADGTVDDGFFDTTQTDFFAESNIISSATDLTALFSSIQVYSGLTNESVDVASRGSFSLTTNGLTWTVIPEPTTALGGLLLVGGLLRRRRRA